MKLGILFGGVSAEHEVSLTSTKNVLKKLKKAHKYEPFPIGIDREGFWYDCRDNLSFEGKKRYTFFEAIPELLSQVDVVFSLLHGRFGEDGAFQGLLEVAKIPYVGTSVLGSSINMDKDICKRLLRDAGIPTAKFLSFITTPDYEFVTHQLGSRLFIKPANGGSSVGMTRATNEEEFIHGVELAFLYDTKIIIEEEIRGREFECAVLGHDHLEATVPGEIIPKGGIFTYEIKYLDLEGAQYIVPAPINEEKIAEMQNLSKEVFRMLACEGMARVDFFLTEEGKLFVNEVNTVPGFTELSYYPVLWEYEGLTLESLIERLIDLAFLKFERKKNLETFYEPLHSRRDR